MGPRRFEPLTSAVQAEVTQTTPPLSPGQHEVYSIPILAYAGLESYSHKRGSFCILETVHLYTSIITMQNRPSSVSRSWIRPLRSPSSPVRASPTSRRTSSPTWDEIRLSNPVFEGDTIYSQSEVLEKRESRSRKNVGIVKVKTTGFNQEGKVVITFNRMIMVCKKVYAPEVVRVIPEEG